MLFTALKQAHRLGWVIQLSTIWKFECAIKKKHFWRVAIGLPTYNGCHNWLQTHKVYILSDGKLFALYVRSNTYTLFVARSIVLNKDKGSLNWRIFFFCINQNSIFMNMKILLKN